MERYLLMHSGSSTKAPAGGVTIPPTINTTDQNLSKHRIKKMNPRSFSNYGM